MPETIFSREELYKLVWSEPLARLAKKYKTKDWELRKLCAKQSIPLPKSGHWMKLKYGKKVKVEPLPELQSDSEQFDIAQPEPISILKELSPLQKLKEEIENDPDISLIVPLKLTKPDILITQARDTILNPGDYHTGYKSSSGFHWWEVLKINVAPANLSRALRIMDTLIKALKVRGHQIRVGRETCIVIHSEEIKVNLREKNKRVIVHHERYGNSSELIPTGILTFNIEGFHPKEWKDGKKMLEEQLSIIIAKLELEGKRLKEESEYYKKQREEREVKERILLEQRQLQEKEQQKFQILLHSAEKFREASLIREYVNAVEEKAMASGEVTESLKLWLAWARKKTDSYDPLVSGAILF